MSRFIRALVRAARSHFRSVIHIVSFTLVIAVLYKEGAELLVDFHKSDLTRRELLMALAGAADSLHSFIADFCEFFASEE